MTEKLYYKDSHIKEFTAKVVSCEQAGELYEIELDRTAFFPEGGGQSADTGVIDTVNVLYTFERGDAVVHRTDAPLIVGTDVTGKIDWDRRFRNMQNHTGEHLISGLIHAKYGFDNVGFHMGEDGVIVDFNGFVPHEELSEIEKEANRVIHENRTVTAFFPDADELSQISYRSKLDLKDNVRIVTIEGYDVCACCAPHVHSTGEIGIIKIFESIHRKDGVRLRMLSGFDAYEDYCRKAESAGSISALLSAKQDEIVNAVKRVLSENERLQYELGGFKREMIRIKTESLSNTDGNLVFFEPSFGVDELRMLVNSAVSKCTGICAAFSGDDMSGYKYVMASESLDMRSAAKDINASLSGRGGGKAEMISGSVSAKKLEIYNYFCPEKE